MSKSKRKKSLFKRGYRVLSYEHGEKIDRARVEVPGGQVYWAEGSPCDLEMKRVLEKAERDKAIIL